MSGAAVSGELSRVESDRPRVLYVVTHPMTLELILGGQLRFLREKGFDVTVACGAGPELRVVAERERVRIVTVPLCREVSPGRDIVALLRLCLLMRRERPDVVFSVTPKAGLLGTVAAFLTRVPMRVYGLYGLRVETVRGPIRGVLLSLEWFAAKCATSVVAVSRSLRRRYLALGLCEPWKIVVLGAGSANGVNVESLRARAASVAKTATKRREGTSITFGYFGRITRDKGVEELIRATTRVRASFPGAELLIVGRMEEEDPVDEDTKRALMSGLGVTYLGYVEEVGRHLAGIDVLVLPSHREGLPTVVLEAAALRKPCVGYAATGVRDVVRHEATGILVPRGDEIALAKAMLRYCIDPELIARHGQEAAAFVCRYYEQREVWRNLLAFLRGELVRRNGNHTRHERRSRE